MRSVLPVPLHVQSAVNASAELVVTVTAVVMEEVTTVSAVAAVALFRHVIRSQPRRSRYR